MKQRNRRSTQVKVKVAPDGLFKEVDREDVQVASVVVPPVVGHASKRLNPWAPAEPTIVFDTYWKFAAERQAVFLRRAAGLPPPWTNDPILQAYRFTNAYRAADRVSQYLIRNVVYDREHERDDLFFRIILFKLFNRIETWEWLTEKIGGISWRAYDGEKYDRALSEALRCGRAIYSAAYMMPAGRNEFGSVRKHRNHLRLLEKMMRDQLPKHICGCRKMKDAFELLRGYPTIGDFLAYQFVTDINYSTLTDFPEMDFVAAGPGARDGLRKCFKDFGGLNEAELITLVARRQEEEFARRGLEFQALWGRPLQLIDCQNLFCEVDKYARVAHPEAKGFTGRSRIKRRYAASAATPIDYVFPPKWGLDEAIQRWRRQTRPEATITP